MALVGYWSFDGDALDRSGYGNHGTPVGSPSYISGQNGQAINFTGTSCVSVPDSSVLEGFTECTVSTWLNLNNYPTGSFVGTMIRKQSDVGDRGIISFWVEGLGRGAAKKVTANISGGSGFATGVSSASIVPLSTWLHLLFTFKMPNLRIYFNSVLDSSRTNVSFSQLETSSNTLEIGRYRSIDFVHSLDGAVYGTKILSHEAQQEEINQIYLNGLNKLIGASKAQMLRADVKTSLLRSQARTSILRGKTRGRMVG